MGLVGNLEDLGLGDILQIVSLSRKSGMLNLSWNERKGRIIFRDGQVVGAESNEKPTSLEKLIADHNIASPQVVAEAVALKKGLGPAKTLRSVLTERLKVNASAIEDAIREHIEKIVYGFFMWPEGNFSFDLKEGNFLQTEIGDITREVLLASGMNPQFLAMEGTRLQDEARRDGKFQPVAMPESAGDEKPAPPPAAPPPAPAAKAQPVAARPAPAPAKPAPPRPAPAHAGPPKAVAVPPSAPQPAKPKPASAPLNLPRPPAPKAPAAETNIDAEISRAKEFPHVLVVDDDPEILKLVIGHIRSMSLAAEGTLKIGDAIDRIKNLVSQGFCPAVLVDLFMPRTDGQGILGGLQLVQQVKSRYPYVPILMFSDYQNAAAEGDAFKAGLDQYIDKPKRSQIWGDDPTPELLRFKENLSVIVPELVEKAVPPPESSAPPVQEPQPEPIAPKVPKAPGPIMPGAPVADTDGMWNPGKELRMEFGEEEPEGSEIIIPSRGINLLKNMINELGDPEFAGQISLLVLRFAAELMNRSVIFLVMRDKVAGLGQFGVGLNGVDPLKQVRKMRIPLDEPSVFRDVIFRKATLKKPLADTKWNNYLINSLGGRKPIESFAAPLVAGGKVAAILYGDNIPELKPIGETDSLEIFLAQAGLTMERTLLERRLSELNSREKNPGAARNLGR